MALGATYQSQGHRVALVGHALYVLRTPKPPTTNSVRARRSVGNLYSAILGVQVGAGFTAVLIGGLQKADTESISRLATAAPRLASFAVGLQQASWWLLPTLLIVSGGLGLLKKLLGPPWLWQTVHSYLDVFREDVFNFGPDDAVHHHRVTLFKYVGWCWRLEKWPWSGWLVPVERSGHTTQSQISVFRAPDDADHAEGVAGMTWARRGQVMVSHLPDLEASPSDDAFRAYSRATGVSVADLKRKVPRARSYCGLPVEVKGNLWGVLIFDSRSPDGINHDSQVLFRPLGKYLGKLLERV